jgi:FAD/FMN-containing dehydrogenase
LTLPGPLPLSSHAKPVDSFPLALELEKELKRVVRGEVRFDRGSRALYATDGSNYRQVPIGLVVPQDESDVIAAVAACRRFKAPILARGAGTSLAGQCCNVAVVLDFTKYMNRVLEIDSKQRFARVQPGVVLDSLRDLAEAHQLTFAPDPSTHNRCTIGGMIGNNSCGTHSLLGGKTVDNVEELRILLYDGTVMTVGATRESQLEGIIQKGGRCGALYTELRGIQVKYAGLIRAKFPKIPRRVSGYNLD